MTNNNSKLRKKISGETIMRGTNQNSKFLKKLKEHLKVLFQFDCADLDFGIYRIMNYKRKEIEKFIEDDLIGVVEKEFEKYKVQNQKELLERIEEKRKEIRKLEKELGEKIFKNSEIEEKFRDRPFAKEYLELKKQIDEIDITESIQSQVFNDLYNFFSRYYEDGDFISKRRFSSKQNKYAIPYSGEEVKLYWANFDQYYIKTGEVFKDYEFNQKGWKFVFRTVLADVEAGNVKGNRRYFLLSPDEPVKISNKACLIKFEYRMLTNGDLRQYPVKTKEGKSKTTGIMQDELNPILKDKILTFITPLEPKAILNETQDEKTILEKHLHKYTRKITSDFFIHKNLKDFLERQLDYFIKTEVLDIDSLDTEKERYFDKHITRAKVVKNIGEKIIEFLSQIEDFQKMLWEKKKFVLKTDYVISIDQIPEDFYKEILENKEQLKEWQELGLGKIKTKKELNGKKLPVDSTYFSEDFKERFLEKVSGKDSLDDLIDGILIKSENWQALNLILEKYRGKAKCIYIDPPFNTGKDFLFKDKYQDSCWLALMENRLQLGKDILSADGSIFLHLDWNADYLGRLLLDLVFGKDNFLNEIIWRIGWLSGYKTSVERFVRNHDVLLFYGRDKNTAYFDKDKAYIPYSSFERATIDNEIKSIIRKWNIPQVKNVKITFKDESWKVFKIGLVTKEGRYPIEDTWNCSEYEELHSNKIKRNAKEYTPNGSEITQKPEELLKRAIELTTKKNELVLDFFLGSATTNTVAQKLNRKWIGIEMAGYFETDAIYRIKHVLAGASKREPVGISKVVNWQGGGFFKYHYLEQYEDSLHNIEFPQEEKGQKLLQLLPEEAKSEYLMKYMLRFETEESPSLLDLEAFESPFEYKLKIISNGKGEEIVDVDLVETFNYLIGLRVSKYKFLKENGRKYVFVSGERNNRRTAIVWRSFKNIDLKKDKEIIDKELASFNPDEIFINGDSFVKSYKPIESEFKALMGV